MLNAYVHGDIANAFYRMEDQLRERGFRHPMLVVHANGGNARVAKTVALNTLNSGPAVATHGAATVAKLLEIPDVVTGDMGGTSFDIAVIKNGTVPVTSTPNISGVRIATSMVDVETAGAGGGSIARVVEGNLTVGPDSAGAVPGPASYDRGGFDPTVTDANLLLGFIDPANFLGGRFTLATARAERAVRTRLAQPLGISTEAAALQVRSVIADVIAAALKARFAEIGADPSTFSFLSIGGAAPLHAVDVAERLGFKEIIAFPFGSVFSAFGGSTTSIRHVYSRAVSRRDAAVAARLLVVSKELEALATEDMRGEGVDTVSVVLERFLENREGESRRVTIAGGNLVGEDGTAWRPSASSITNVRVVSTAPVNHYVPPRRAVAGGPPEPKSSRAVWWSASGPVSTAIFNRDDLGVGHRIVGPAIVEGPDTIYAVGAAWQLDVDPHGFYRMTRRNGTPSRN